ncbi:MAG: CRISPR-associated endonuclease Cas1 [Thermoplasmata archaeon]|nr:CRISPR-associated endonuclease Cas1 [Thermoplasmata archaeon]
MKSLYLDGTQNISLTKEGLVFEDRERGTSQVVAPPDIDFDLLVVQNTKGYVSWPALKVLQMWRVTVCQFDWTGKLLGTFVPYAKADPPLMIRQMEVSRDPKAALKIAQGIVAAKMERMGEAVEEWGGSEEYETIRHRRDPFKTKSNGAVLSAEGAATEAYWGVFRQELTRRWPEAKFPMRGHHRHQYKIGAVDPVNAALNYAYSILEAKARTNLARVGLSPYFGFLHAPLTQKEPAVYDLQEYERATMDRAVLDVLADSEVQKHGFSKTERWISRLSRHTSRKTIAAVDDAFNVKVGRETVDGRFYRNAIDLRRVILDG